VTRSRLRAILVLGCALLCTALLAACGGSDDGQQAPAPTAAEAKLQKTFGAASTSIERASIIGQVRLDPEGLLKVGGPIALRVQGPFVAPSGRTPARFALGFVATLGGDKFRGRAISTAERSFLTLDDKPYALGDREPRATAAPKSHPGLRSLGVDPLDWIANVTDGGAAKIGDEDTTRLTGDVNAKALLADVGRLLDTAGAASFITPELLDQIAGAVKSAKVDLWTGAEDDILRQITVDVRFAFERSQSPIVGLDGGHLRLRLRLDDVNGAPVQISAPAGAQPLTELTGPGGLDAVLAGVGKGLTGGIGGGALDLVNCVSLASGSSVELIRCLADLGK
jgi:hypothetical protein